MIHDFTHCCMTQKYVSMTPDPTKPHSVLTPEGNSFQNTLMGHYGMTAYKDIV